MSVAETELEKIHGGTNSLAQWSEELAKRIWSGFVIGMGVVALFAAVWYMGAARYKQATSWIIQAHLALERLDDLRYSMAQAGSRAAIFTVSGDNANLAPFQASEARAREDLSALGLLTRGSQLQQQMLDSLVPVVQTRLTLTSDIVAARISRGQEAAAELLKSEQLRKVVEEFDARIDQIEAAEQQLVSSRLSTDQFLARIAVIIVICSVALGFVAIGSAGSFISRAFAMMRESITDEASGRETLRHLNGRLEGWITERTAAAEQRTLELEDAQGALHQQTHLLQSLLVSMSDAVIACDTQMELIEFNPAAERLLGPTIRTLPIDQWAKHIDLVDEENGRKIGRDDWPLLRAARGEEFRSTWLLRQVDQKRWLEGCGAPIRDKSGSILGAAMIFRDITDRQQSAARLREAHDLALESARLRSEFLNKMSHEIRTPLNGIIGMTQLLLETELNDDQRDHLRTVGSSGNLLLRIVNDVLDFSKLTAGKVALDQSPFDLYEAVETTVETFAPRAQSQNIELILALSPDVPRDAHGDSRALTQVLSNLVSNAIEFTESGEVVVEVSRAIPADAPGAIRFAIRDTGIGIAPQARERLFDPFSQTDGSTRSRYGRSGLGLAISSRLVEGMGGRINLESQVGVGSTFSFTISLIAAPDSPQRTLEGPGLDGLNILLAEANPTAREVLTARLRAWGIITDTVATSDEAREAVCDKLAAHQRYDFILLDATLPPIDGIDLARALRLVLEATPSRILMMGRAAAIHATEDHSAENAAPQNPATNGREDASSNIDGWIRKPVRPSVLCERLLAFAPPSDHARPIRAAGSHRPPAHPHAASLSPQAVHVLVIEDNPVNLKLALLQLKKLGYPASGAKTARAGLDLLATRNFPIVLMDCEMPEIDGYAATREIRQGETGANHTVVIAMTAHAVEGAREKCLEAGMDDFLAKPVTLESLGAALERWAALIKYDSSDTLSTANFEAHTSLDPSPLTEIRELSSSEDGDAVGELVTLFLDDLPARLEEMATAIHANDLESAGMIAHRLKGACASMGATRLGAMCEMAESSARQGDSALLTTVLSQARAEADHVRSLLETEQQRPAA